MADAGYSVIFEGKLVDGADIAKVKANLGKLFKMDDAKVDALMSGKRVVIKKGVDQATADNYKAVLAKAGAIAEVIAPAEVPVASSAPPPPPAAEPASAPAAAPAPGEAAYDPINYGPNAPPAAVLNRDGPPQAMDTTMAEVGATLVEAEQVAPPDIATDHLQMAEVGAELAEKEPVPEPDYDISSLSMVDS
ncbi:MAG: hypothetical protein AAF384_19165 [Pseudomonadota bacterium]